MLQLIQSLDTQALLWIQENLRAGVLTPIMLFITSLGNSGLFWIGLSLALLIPRRTRTVGFLCLLALALNFLINNMILKNMVARIRPYDVIESLNCLVKPEKDLSFPSGHAGSSFAAATVLFLMLPKAAGIPALILAILISLSRLYIGVHYPTDVLVGVLIGALVAVVVVKNYRKKSSHAS